MGKKKFMALFSFLLLFEVFLLVVVLYSPRPNYNWHNSRYFHINNDIHKKFANNGFDPEKKTFIGNLTKEWKKRELQRWELALKEVFVLLPEGFLNEFTEYLASRSFDSTSHQNIISYQQIKVDFYADPTSWSTGTVNNSGIEFNLCPTTKKPEWMSWETLHQNGFSRKEMIWVILHELGHLLDSRFDLTWEVYDNEAHSNKELKVSLYTTKYGLAMGKHEDLADAFAPYVMWPEYLKNNFPVHYGVILKTLKRKYRSYHCMPEFVRTKLTVSFEAKRCWQ